MLRGAAGKKRWNIMARTIQYSFPSKADGLVISCLALVPELGRDEKYRGIIQIVHGMSEYKERYLPFMEYMAEHKYVSVIHDHRGHGKSVRDKEDLGYMYGGGADAMLQDIHTVNGLIRDHFPEIPLILFGHSMGSLAVRAYAAHHDNCMDMLIVCGSPSYNALRPVGVALAKAEKAVFGPKHSAGLIEAMSFGTYALRFRKEKNRFSWICSDPQVVQDYSDSEYCGFTFSDDAYLALFDLMKRAYDVKHWNCTKPKLPVLFISGADDPCMGNVRHFAKAVRAMRQAGYQDVRGKLYPGMRHEILNEADRKRVYRDIFIYIHKKEL